MILLRINIKETYTTTRPLHFLDLLNNELYSEVYDKLRITDDDLDGIHEAISDYLINCVTHNYFYKKLINKSINENRTSDIQRESIKCLGTISLRFYENLVSLGIGELKAGAIHTQVLYSVDTIKDFTQKELEELLFFIVNDRFHTQKCIYVKYD